MADNANSGGFFGGLSSGITEGQKTLQEQQAQQLAQQKQKALEANQAKEQATAQVTATINHINEIIKAAAANGNDPKSVKAAIDPLVQSAQGLAQAAGMPQDYVPSTVGALLARPAGPGEEAHSIVKVSGALGEPDKVLRVEKKSGNITAIDPNTGLPMGTKPAPGGGNLTGTPTNPTTITGVSVTDATPGRPQQTAALSPGPTASDAQPSPPKPSLPPGTQPGMDAIKYAVQNNVTGPEFLNAVPPQFRNTITGLNDYKIDPAKLSKRVDKSGQSEYTRMLSWAHQADPSYDPKYYKPMEKALTEFMAGGQSSPASQITAGNVAIQHLGTMADAYDKMQEVPGLLDKIAKSNTSIASYAAARLKNEAIRGTSEGQALSAFMVARERYSAEIERFYAGAKGADAALQRSQAALDAGYSPSEMYSALNAEGHLLSGKVNALQDRWKTSQAGPRFNDALFRNAIPDFPIIQDKSKQTLDRLSQSFVKLKAPDAGASPAGKPNDPLGLR